MALPIPLDRQVLVSNFDGTMTRRDFYQLVEERLPSQGTSDWWGEYQAGRVSHFEALRHGCEVEVKKPKILGQFIFWGEEVYLPEADLILLMNLFKRPDGKLRNVVWAPNANQFYWTDLQFVENGKPVEFKEPPFSWSEALSYDRELKLLVLNNSNARRVWTLKFDRKTAGLEEMKDE